ncbi:MAG: hypothetical protein NTV60_00065 [Candidatus Kaiserbacteria bacterium]|nr:hypothetical protein [Candidatus Kaiserbacteria bacterium]
MDTHNSNNTTLAALFGNNPDISLDERARVLTELQKIGSLTFNLTTDAEGWVAQCGEVPGILAGGTNPKPTSAEIESQIRESIYAAFDVKEIRDKTSPYFTYNDVSRMQEGNFKVTHVAE